MFRALFFVLSALLLIIIARAEEQNGRKNADRSIHSGKA